MDCPKCGATTRVTCLERHPNGYRIRRFRRCTSCGHKFRTTQSCEKVDNDGRIWNQDQSRRNAMQGELSPSAILTEQDVVRIRTLYAAGDTSYNALARETGMCKTTIQKIVERKTWRHVS